MAESGADLNKRDENIPNDKKVLQRPNPASVYFIRTTSSTAASGLQATPAKRGPVTLRANKKLLLLKQQMEQEKQFSHPSPQSRRPPLQTTSTDSVNWSIQNDATLQHTSGLATSYQHVDRAQGQTDALMSQTAPARTFVLVPTSRSVPTNMWESAGVSVSQPIGAASPHYAGITSPRSQGISSAATSVSEVDELLANIMDLESIDPTMDSDLSEIDPSLPDISNLLLTAASFAEGSSDLTQLQIGLKPSSSCPNMPVDEPLYRGGRQKEKPPASMTEEEQMLWEKERLKKDNHNVIEKRRRYKINDCIQELATLLPSSYDLDLQNKKGTILQASVDYIQRLKKDHDRMSEMADQQKELERKNRQLMLEVQRLQLTLQSQQMNSQQLQQLQQQQQQAESCELLINKFMTNNQCDAEMMDLSSQLIQDCALPVAPEFIDHVQDDFEDYFNN